MSYYSFEVKLLFLLPLILFVLAAANDILEPELCFSWHIWPNLDVVTHIKVCPCFERGREREDILERSTPLSLL